MKKLIVAILLVLGFLLLLAVACNQSEEAEPKPSPTAPASPTVPPGTEPPPTPSPTPGGGTLDGDLGTPKRERPSRSTPPAGNEDTVKELAPIEKVEVRVLESFPPQYQLHVEFGLRDGCTMPGGYTVEREGDLIRVKVYVTRPADPTVVCIQVYGIASYNINLGSEFVSGKTYTVDVNGAIKTFRTQ